MKKITLGVLAHVDAGKTTLSEAILYLTGTTKKIGRVDRGDTFLDSDSMEKQRGITVFSKEARFSLGETEVTLVDTPGHADFSAEMERTLSVLDLAVLVVSGVEGIQSHTVTLLKLFELYDIPFVVFVNKIDMYGSDLKSVMEELKKYRDCAVDFSSFSGMTDGVIAGDLAENCASLSESLMDEFFEKGSIGFASLAKAIYSRNLIPVLSGSALKMEGMEHLMELIDRLSIDKTYPEEFGARVYKITRDKKGNRLTHLKVTGGMLKAKMVLDTALRSEEDEGSEEKVEQIRLYNGEKFTTVGEAGAGTVCAVLGLKNTYGGQGLGYEAMRGAKNPFIEPALTYTLELPEGVDPVPALQKMRQLEEEDPTLRIAWEEKTGEIRVSVMGELEKDLLKYRIKDKFNLDVSFGLGRVIYKETVTEPVIGIGHYEPLRHYAEVRLLMEPLPEGSGLVFESAVSEDDLAGNWQRLILKHLMERRHKGTLTGSEITDMKITLIAGRAHLKHTEGGDFRQATYRAVRNGLRKAMAYGKARLLEPMYDFEIQVDQKDIGRVMSDMDRLKAICSIEGQMPDGKSIIKGRGPVSTLREYQMELNSFGGGRGRFIGLPGGYGPCHDEEEVIERISYDCDKDVFNPCGSVFTDHGAGVYVEWDAVEEIAHTEGGLRGLSVNQNDPSKAIERVAERGIAKSDEKNLKAIFEKTYGKSKRDEQLLKEARARQTRLSVTQEDHYPMPNPRSQKGRGRSYLVIDGYNVLFQWDELKELREANIDGAREALIEVLENYQGFTGTGITLVFDGYRLKGNTGETMKYGDMNVVYTGEGMTADRYIEDFIYTNGKKYDLTVVTSDRMVQMASFGDGSGRMSSRDLYLDVISASEDIKDILNRRKRETYRPFEEAFKEK